MSGEPIITVQGLGKSFHSGMLRQRYDAIHDVNLTIRSGETWAMAGPNGAGKTTTLHCIIGLLWPTAGSVQVFGTTPRLARPRLGFQTEVFYTYGHLTCEEAVTFYARLSGVPEDTLGGAVNRAIERVGMKGAAKRKCGGFSKGMTQRVGLAQSIVHDPDLVIWDEPTTGLDPEGRALVFELLADMRARGKTVILSTHILDDIEKVCSHLAIIAGGRVQAADTIDALRAAHPAHSLEQIYVSRVRGIQDAR